MENSSRFPFSYSMSCGETGTLEHAGLRDTGDLSANTSRAVLCVGYRLADQEPRGRDFNTLTKNSKRR